MPDLIHGLNIESSALIEARRHLANISKQLAVPQELQKTIEAIKQQQFTIPQELQTAMRALSQQLTLPQETLVAMEVFKNFKAFEIDAAALKEAQETINTFKQQLVIPQDNIRAFSESIEAIRVSLLGKKGLISERMASLGKMAPDERKAAGAEINMLKDEITDSLAARKNMLAEVSLEARLATETIDMTLPVRPQASGTIHPVSQVWEEVVQIFGDLGFSVAEGPHIEDDFHNFDALNMPPDHPARQEHDTFYFNEKPDGTRNVLRTHTSPVQIRTMLSQKPPIRIIAPGRTFRSDSDMTHTPMFNQVEALVIDETTHLGNLKWILQEFCKAFFEVDDVKMRFRASHFPFTEPSMEVDIQYAREGGQLKIGTGDKWLEILGSGMVHPNVIRAGGLDPDKYQGFAFGMGLDRLAMLKYGIPDLRAFFESDLRWLRHYGFRALQVPTLAGGLS